MVLQNAVKMKAFQHFEPIQTIPKNETRVCKIPAVIVVIVNIKGAYRFIRAIAIVISAGENDAPHFFIPKVVKLIDKGTGFIVFFEILCFKRQCLRDLHLMSSDKFKINDIFENAPGVKGPIPK